MFKKILFIGLIVLGNIGLLQAALRIVATTPDVADLVRQVGGDLVKVDVLAKGTEDIHAIPQRPSFVTLLNRADGVAYLGLGAEHAFLPALLEASANADLLPGKKGDINCSRYVPPMDIPTTLNRSEGDQHPDGNPHYNTDPRKGVLMTKAIAEGLTRLDPKNAALYEKNRAAFDKDLGQKILNWGRATERLHGMKAISQHKDMVYMADFLGLQLVAEVEPKPGIAPSPKHLESVVELMKQQNVKLILNEIQYGEKTAQWLSEKTGARVAFVATMGGAFADSQTYTGMIEHNIQAILTALK